MLKKCVVKTMYNDNEIEVDIEMNEEAIARFAELQKHDRGEDES